MKMTWKKKGGNKRLAISQRPNLPFETEEDDNQDSNVQPSNSDSNKPEPSKTPDDSPPSDASLADAFLKEGNKLAEAWITLGRAQLNFGEPDGAIESFDKALAIEPDLGEAQDDRQTAVQLVKKRKHLHSSGVSMNRSRYVVGDGSQRQPS